MPTHEPATEPAQTPATTKASADEPTLAEETTAHEAAPEAAEAVTPEEAATEGVVSEEAATEEAATEEAATGAETKGAPLTPEQERRRLEEQLMQLKRREAELRRAIAMTDHPQLTDAIRELEGKAYVVTKAEERLAQPLSTTEERKRERIEKKLLGLRAKRDELDVAITALETDLAPLGDARLGALQADRTESLRALYVVLARHSEGLERAGLQAASIIPELERWLPELRAMAEANGVEA